MRITVDLAWDASPEPDVAGYKVSWMANGGQSGAVLVQKFPTKLQLSVLLLPKLVYTFSVQAFDMAGNISNMTALKDVYVE